MRACCSSCSLVADRLQLRADVLAGQIAGDLLRDQRVSGFEREVEAVGDVVAALVDLDDDVPLAHALDEQIHRLAPAQLGGVEVIANDQRFE